MKIMAVDYGDARTGLAMCDKTEMLASPLTVIHSKDIGLTVKKTAELALENRAELIVVGHPINMNGTLGPRSEVCKEFAERLGKKSGLPTVMWDERSTTVSAAGFLNLTDTRGKKRKDVIDAVAATIILENYMNYRKNHAE